MYASNAQGNNAAQIEVRQTDDGIKISKRTTADQNSTQKQALEQKRNLPKNQITWQSPMQETTQSITSSINLLRKFLNLPNTE